MLHASAIFNGTREQVNIYHEWISHSNKLSPIFLLLGQCSFLQKKSPKFSDLKFFGSLFLSADLSKSL